MGGTLSGPAGRSAPLATAPCILVVDDDRRVIELLEIALGAHGYQVLSASDGEEAIRVASGRRPDLVVLDVRLPKKSGLEVCHILRQDPEDPHLPIIMVSAASETEARLQGLARGADEYLTKPFSPRELVARIKRLLARAADAREAQRRGQEAELELARTREDAKRAHAELSNERRLRVLSAGFARDLHRGLDTEPLAGRFLLAVLRHLGVSVAALIAVEQAGGPLVPLATRGDGLERFAGLEVSPSGELARLLTGIGRPVRIAELEHFPELRDELAGFIAKGISLLAPLRGAGGLEGLLVADERRDGEDVTPFDLHVLSLLCDTAAVGLANARECCALADGLVETLVARAGEESRDDDSEVRVEAVSLVAGVARMLMLPPRLRRLLAHGAALGAWAESATGKHALALAAAADPTGRLLDLARLVDRGAGEGEETAGDEIGREAVVLFRVARDYAAARRCGSDARRALAQAIDAASADLDDAMRHALTASEVRDSRPATTAS